MQSFKNDTNDSHTLRVISSLDEERDYFLSSFRSEGGLEQIDFLWEKKQKTKALITFQITEDGQAVSLPHAPFGGFWVLENMTSQSLDDFLQSVLSELRHRGVSSVQITQAPKPYGQQTDLINYLLFKNEFVQGDVLSHHLFLGKKKIKKLAQKEMQKLQVKAAKAGLKTEYAPISNFSFLKNIRAWNEHKGYEVNVDENRLIQQVSEFPNRYFLISLMKGSTPVGYSLGVKLTMDSLYYFLSAVDPKASVKHGGELILTALFQLAVEQKVAFVDLGSSDLGEKANHSLMFFKSRFANDISNKVTWIKQL
ncbi:hypothetical protein [Algoriphagus halophytocola]|uniref:GNAT family N-acetyltransferase n=1 Tax=Algoriphagus halophytocola TaxID=2991499 RepID=A0ABY6MKI4_9BACT|nr:hypothetical protein [Algoriphagus sp. TR-M5]UZD24290.1 hypothetical protein OM944_07255 [Algoriphagus sp. TR-M5]